jgi:hypothetical protein
VVDHPVADDRAMDEAAEEVGLLEAGDVALTDCGGAARQQRRRMREILRIVGPARHKGVDVARVVGFELGLGDGREVVHACASWGKFLGKRKTRRLWVGGFGVGLEASARFGVLPLAGPILPARAKTRRSNGVGYAGAG